MVFQIPDSLAPEVYPLAWLVGKWEGYVHMSYPGIDQAILKQEIVVDHDGGPYLKMTSTLWQAESVAGEIYQGMKGAEGAALITPGLQWATETVYWRPVPGQQIGPAEGAKAGDVPPTALEVLAADPAGHLILFAGVAQGPRIQLASDQILRSGSAAELTACQRMYGLLRTELLWVQEMAAFGKEMSPYLSGQLSRVEESDPLAGLAD